jgi:hypothetical protein
MPSPVSAGPLLDPWWWAFDPRRSLRARAAGLVLAGTLLFTAAFSWTAGAVLQRLLAAQLGAHFETLAFQVADKIDRTLYERYRTLTLGSGLTAIRDHSAPVEERRRVLQALQEASPDLVWIGVADPSGRVLAGTGRRFEDTSVANRAWFRSAREVPYAGPLREIPELTRTGPGDPVPDADNLPRFIDLAVPLPGADGTFAGVLGAHLRWNWTRDVHLSVVPDTLARERIGVTVYAGNDPLLDSGASGWSHPPDAPAIEDQRRARGYAIEPTGLGTTYLTGFARSRGFREFRGLGWLAVVRQPVDRAFAPVAALRRNIATWGIALAFAAAGAAWFLTAHHARRLRSLRASAVRIHEGDVLAVLPRPPGDSELARTCGALGDLVEDLRARPTPAPPPAPPRSPAP